MTLLLLSKEKGSKKFGSEYFKFPCTASQKRPFSGSKLTAFEIKTVKICLQK
jgi:hypothetical protein